MSFFSAFFLLAGVILQIRGASYLGEEGLTGEVCALRPSRDVSAGVGRYKGEGVSSVPPQRGAKEAENQSPPNPRIGFGVWLSIAAFQAVQLFQVLLSRSGGIAGEKATPEVGGTTRINAPDSDL